MKTSFLAAAFALATALATALAPVAAADRHGAEPAAAPDADPQIEAQAEKNFGAWAAALATRDPKAVAALFAPNAILQPTVSNVIRDTPETIEAYFVDFLKLEPKPTINERHVELLDETTVLDAGIWTFDLVRGGKPVWVTARYAFIWEKIGEDWKIQLLHSSMMPEPLADRPAPLASN